ncbi:mCG147944 [Mus musculus]|nr:mCG147944 [Mus musculus]
MAGRLSYHPVMGYAEALKSTSLAKLQFQGLHVIFEMYVL